MQTPDLKERLAALHTEAYGWALACTNHAHGEAEDVLQAAYLKILEGKARFSGQAEFKTWLFSVIRNTAVDSHRRRMARTLFVERFRWNGVLSRDEPSAETGVAEEERAILLRRHLQQLPRRQREVLHLVFYQDMTIETAAEVLGISVGSARKHYARGKEKMKQRMASYAR